MASKVGELFFDILVRDDQFRKTLEGALTKADRHRNKCKLKEYFVRLSSYRQKTFPFYDSTDCGHRDRRFKKCG